MWPGFKSRRRRHLWVDLLMILSFPPRCFYPGSPVFPSPQKPIFPNSNSRRNREKKNHFVDALSPNHYLFIFYLKFDRHPSKLVNINCQSSKLPRHWDTLFREVLKGSFGRGVPPVEDKKLFILQTCLTKETLFYDPNSFFFSYRIEIFFKKNIAELDNLEYKLFVAHMEITHRKPSHSFFGKASDPKRHPLQESYFIN